MTHLPHDTSHPGGDTPSRTSPVMTVLAWLVVLIPLAWGVAMTARTSVRLFQTPPAANAPVHPR